MIHLSKETFGYLSIAGYIAATIPYCLFVIQGKTKPHVFTWLIWALVMGIAAAARSAENAGPGAWTQWAGAGVCFVTVIFAMFKGERQITLSDKIAFVAALAAIPVWRATHDPFTAIVIVSAIDALGYYPTLRKSWARPKEESAFNYVIATGVNMLSLAATSTYDLQTVLYPAVLMTCNTVLISLIWWRRRALKATARQ